MSDWLQCLIGGGIGLIGGLVLGIAVGIRLYWKTRHW